MENVEHTKICTLDSKNSNNPVLNVEFLPNEILMNIFSHLNIKDVYICAQVSKKFRQISHDESFWKCVNLSDQNVSCEFISQIIKLGTEYLNLQGATLLEEYDADLPRKNNLKYLNLAESSVDDKFLVKLLRSSKSLEKLSLTGVNVKHFYEMYEQYKCNHSLHFSSLGNIDSMMLEVRTSWYIECLLPNAKMLTSLDLKGTRYPQIHSFINFESIKEIILVCEELREANFQNQCRIEDDLDFFANNLTTKIEKLNISQIGILDEHMVKLLNRCKNITELDLLGCDLNKEDGLNHPEQRTLMAISENLSLSLVKLQLPDHSFIYPDFLNSLPKLKYLWHQRRNPLPTSHPRQDNTWIESQFPQIAFNEGIPQIANCANEYFEPKFGFWELKCTALETGDYPESTTIHAYMLSKKDENLLKCRGWNNEAQKEWFKKNRNTVCNHCHRFG